MKALLLAAGYGSRLGELTKKVPKPMIEVAGKPIIQHIIDNLYLHGITQIIINIHYLSEILSDAVGNRAIYYYEPKLLGHKGTIYALKDWLNYGDFFVINGDTLNDINYSDMISSHKPGTITAAMDEWRCVGTWIYSKEYFNKELSVVPYRPNMTWFDTGTPEKLKKAKDYYETPNRLH